MTLSLPSLLDQVDAYEALSRRRPISLEAWMSSKDFGPEDRRALRAEWERRRLERVG